MNKHIYKRPAQGVCHGRGDDRKCPVCEESTDAMLPSLWYHEGIPWMAFFCEKHGVEDLEEGWNV